MQSLELRRLLTDLVWCYKVVFCLVDINVDDFFSFSNLVVTRGHQYKLYKKRTVSHVRATFFSERVINVWNSLPKDVDFGSLSRFKRSILQYDARGKYLSLVVLPSTTAQSAVIATPVVGESAVKLKHIATDAPENLHLSAASRVPGDVIK